MLISKFYNRYSGKSSNMPSNDPRIITPSSIPIFILPPTMDAYSNNSRPELNGKSKIFNFFFNILIIKIWKNKIPKINNKFNENKLNILKKNNAFIILNFKQLSYILFKIFNLLNQTLLHFVLILQNKFNSEFFFKNIVILLFWFLSHTVLPPNLSSNPNRTVLW